ncbi:MAG TPA: polysaccharide biosynthesis protein, partial [Aggregatilineales bacterium]|nr:polysaccharide biosynthesis protein [Aggregatilineales bacterium]
MVGLYLIDATVVVVAFLAAYSVRAVTTDLEFKTAVVFIAFSALVTPIVLHIVGVYRHIWSMTSGHGVKIILNGSILLTVFLTAIDLLFRERPLPLSVLWLGSILAFGGSVFVRYQHRLINRVRWLGQSWNSLVVPPESDVTRVLIVGANEAGQNLAWRLKHRIQQQDANFKLIGFVDDDARKQGRFVEEIPILGCYADIPRVADSNQIDLIILAFSIDSPEGRAVLGSCEQTKARIKLLPDMVSYLNTKLGAALLRSVEPHDLIGRGSISHHEGVALELLNGKTVLVTGAAGSIGSELCRQLAGFPISTLILLDNNESGLHDLFIELAPKHPALVLVPMLADITVRRTLRAAFQENKPDVIFHAAAYKHVPMLEKYPNEALRVNIGGTR